MIKFPSIEQFRNVIRNVTHRARFVGVDANGDPQYNPHATLPKLKYRGTVKLHGTNAGIVFDIKTGEFSFQSRERVLSLEQDNAGFMLSMSNKLNVLKDLINDFIRFEVGNIDKVVVFGEWAGGNIQSGVALSGLPKMFVIFAVKVIDGEKSRWLDMEQFENLNDPPNLIYVSTNFKTWEVEIDFDRPHEIQNQLVELTTEVEAKCPVGEYFGNEGIGEGIVWTCIEPGWWSSDYWFKVKGEKHSASKVKKLASVDVEAIRAIEQFVDMAVTEGRLEQGLQNLVREQLKPFVMTSMGDFIKWVFNDVMKEERDTIVENQLDPKKLGGPIANKARKWYIDKFNEGFKVE